MKTNRLVTLTESGPLLDPPVSWQAVQNWLSEGCDARRPDGLIDLDKLIAWRARFRRDPDKTRHGGRVRGAGRPKGSKNKTKIMPPPTPAAPSAPIGTEPGPTSRPIPLTEREILERNARGELTTVELDQARDAMAALAKIREHAIEAGQLLPVTDVREAWGEFLRGHKDALEELPDRARDRAATELNPAPTPAQAAAIRRIIDEEVRQIVSDLCREPIAPPKTPAAS